MNLRPATRRRPAGRPPAGAGRRAWRRRGVCRVGEHDRGAVAVIVALLVSTVLISISAFAVDFGNAFARRAELQGVADVAARAGALYLPDVDQARTAAVNALCAGRQCSAGLGVPVRRRTVRPGDPAGAGRSAGALGGRRGRREPQPVQRRHLPLQRRRGRRSPPERRGTARRGMGDGDQRDPAACEGSGRPRSGGRGHLDRGRVGQGPRRWARPGRCWGWRRST